eukprot:XP_019077144.1 PREDICTED: uncharacterized protein LOC104880068 isoform X3 [Vitis vinifera]
MGRMEIKIQFCPTIWESDSGERIGQGSFRCASSLAPVRVVARFRCASGRASGRFGVSFRVLSRRAQVSELARNASGARRCKLQGRVEARSGERIGQETLQVCVEPRSSARRGALQVTVGARFRSLRGALQGRVEGRSGERIGQGSFRCASSLAPVRVEARFRCASRRASGARRGALRGRVKARFGVVSRRASERGGYPERDTRQGSRMDEARFRCPLFRPGGWTRQSECG